MKSFSIKLMACSLFVGFYYSECHAQPQQNLQRIDTIAQFANSLKIDQKLSPFVIKANTEQFTNGTFSDRNQSIESTPLRHTWDIPASFPETTAKVEFRDFVLPPHADKISRAFVFPRTKFGIGDAHIDDGTHIINSRYRRFSSMNLGYKEYNYWWSSLEDSGLSSTATPVPCPSGYVQIPSSAYDKSAMGFHRYRCLNQAVINNYANAFRYDAANGIQTGIVFWSSPPQYRYPGCTGAPWGAGILKDGCVPRDDAMDDFEDILTFLAYQYNGLNGAGKISHFIIWNENASATWFDYSPVVTNRGPVSTHDTNVWLNKYADMLRRAHSAVQKVSEGVMLYASTDPVWHAPRTGASDPSHLGTQNLLDGLWARLGTSISWSVAVHPYGEVNAPIHTSSIHADNYSFYNVEMVSKYMQDKLAAAGFPRTSLDYPQGYIIASEQGWGQISDGIEGQGRNLCLAHEKTLRVPTLITQGHNYFQSVERDVSDGGTTSSQGELYGLLPHVSQVDLSDMENYATGLAYLSLNPAVWGHTDDHYCCKRAGVGCASSSPYNKVYRFYDDRHHFFTTNPGEAISHGYHPEGLIKTFDAAYASSHPGLIPIYRCYVTRNGDHFMSRDSGCEGQRQEGNYGYVYRDPTPGTDPLYRLYNTGAGDHLASFNPTEGAPAFHVESILGYLPTGTSVTPLYRYIHRSGHHYTLDWSERGTNRLEQLETHVFTYQNGGGFDAGGGNLVPLYRCYNPAGSDQMLSTSVSCETRAYRNERTVGFISTTPGPGLVPLYRFNRSGPGHLQTLNPAEGFSNGYSLDGVLGYVPAP